MPYILIAAESVNRGPTKLGDQHLPRDITGVLQAKWGGIINEHIYTDLPPRIVDKLEVLGYQVIAMGIGGEGNSSKLFGWTLHKPITPGYTPTPTPTPKRDEPPSYTQANKS